MIDPPVSDASLVLFLKAPANSKRRLAAQIGELATETAALLWECALEDLRTWRGPAWFSPADREDEAWLVSRLDVGSGIIVQRGENLGQRINHVDAELRSAQEGKLLFIGTDCPGLDLNYLEEAAARLDHVDAVLGPSRDGGVVLMGARRPWPALDELSWSTDRLCAELTARCRRDGWTVGHLDVRSDVDTVSHLLAARHELANDERAARRALVAWSVANDARLRAVEAGQEE